GPSPLPSLRGRGAGAQDEVVLRVNTCHKICRHHCRSAIFRDQGWAREAIASAQTLAVIDRRLTPLAVAVHGDGIHLRCPRLLSLFPFSPSAIGGPLRANHTNTHGYPLGGTCALPITRADIIGPGGICGK